VTRPRLDEREQLRERLGSLAGLGTGPTRVGEQLLRHLHGRKYVVDHARRDRAVRHPLVQRGGLVLNHHHTELVLDRFKSQGAVGSGSRQDDPDRHLALIGGERAKHPIDRHRRVVWIDRPPDAAHLRKISSSNPGRARYTWSRSIGVREITFAHDHLRLACEQLGAGGSGESAC